MGCHTWCYKRAGYKSIEDMKKIIIDNKESLLKYCKEKITSRTYEDDIDKRDTINVINQLERQITSINKLSNYMKVLSLYSKELNVSIIYKSKLYINTDYHDLFRCNYNSRKLISYSDTIKFLSENVCLNINYDKIKEFWDNYPDGIIDFG